MMRFNNQLLISRGVSLLVLLSVAGTLLTISGCSSDGGEVIPDCASSDLALSVVSADDPTCGNPGTIEVMATGGSGTYMYTIVGGDDNGTSPVFDNLQPGTYTIEVSDGDCQAAVDVTLSGTDAIAVEVAKISCEDGAAEIQISATGGSGNYQYQLNDNDATSNSSFENLSYGTYVVTVFDDNGCSTTLQEVELREVTLSGDIWPIVERNCAIAGCHGNNQAPIYDDPSVVIDFAERIKARTSSGTMPPTGPLPADEIELIAQWVDCGAQDN